MSARFLTTIEERDVGLAVLKRPACSECGRPRMFVSSIGVIQTWDIGKRVYDVDGVIQTENNEQRDRRLRAR